MTHDVLNQVPPLVGFDGMDYPVFQEALQRFGATGDSDSLHEIGQAAGSAHAFALGDRAEAHQPVLHTHDRFGYRVDQVAYDPSYHELMTTATRFGLHGTPWLSDDPNAHVVRAIGLSLWGAVDAGHQCPITMTPSPPCGRPRSSPSAMSPSWRPAVTTRRSERRMRSRSSPPVCR